MSSRAKTYDKRMTFTLMIGQEYCHQGADDTLERPEMTVPPVFVLAVVHYGDAQL